MASAPSLKELTKAINAFVPTATLPLPDDLVEIIEGYLSKHEKLDESVAEKLDEELISIYQKDVLGTPARYGPFLNILRRFRTVIANPDRTLRWWELLEPYLQVLAQEKGLAAEGQDAVLAILTADEVSDPENPVGSAAGTLAEKLLTLWLDECEVAGRAEDALTNFRERQLRNTLIIYGKKRPRDFMTMLDRFLAKKDRRCRTLHLMSDFIRNRPPHLHQILQTPLFGSLINCLQLDTSTTVVSLALTVLTMVLPHMPSSLVPHLPTLFNIYARLLFWQRELSSTELGVDVTADRRLSPSAAAWEKSSYSPDFDDTAILHLLNYFTILYGLYPINFMDYIRKPQRYLRHAEVPNSDDIEVQPTEIRHASEQFRQCHVLHENFYTLTIDSEKTDFGRWIKSEPAEVVADCMSLRQTIEATADSLSSHFGMPEPPMLSIKDDIDKDGHEAALLSRSVPLGVSPSGVIQNDSWRSSQPVPVGSPTSSRVQSTVFRQSSHSSHQSYRDSSSTRLSVRAGDSPTLPAVGSYTQLQDMIDSNKAIKSGIRQSLANDSVPSLALSHQDSISERHMSVARPNLHSMDTPISANESSNGAGVHHLYRQILLLHNDLTFERFMKQQHLTHMGELRRRQVREAASEAETQNLIMANRNLKKRLEEAKKTEIQVKRDSERSRTVAKKWEADLSTRFRNLREEQKKWVTEGNTLRDHLDKAKTETDALRKLICDAEVRELGWKQKLQYVEASASEMERLKQEVDSLTESRRKFEAQEIERQATISKAAEADSRVEMLKMQLTARETESRQTNDIYQSQIVVLNAKLQEALKGGVRERDPDRLEAQMQDILAASRTQQAALKRRLTDLTRNNTALNATILELQSTMPTRSRSDPQRSTSPEVDMSITPPENGSPLSFRNRQHRGFSDTTFEAVSYAMSYNPTKPLEPFDAVLRPSTPSIADGSGSIGGKTSPTMERYHGRGGVQNVVKKDKRDKNSDNKDKKKAGGIRGIRGFV
ncbi:Hamartin protein-domain-containing protein [Xylariales sp. AK1849]|nr:Hamartin protein-domain-containing protein [Xylariales sp. AK1849]